MAIIESSRRRAVESLLADESITADLIDDAACPLLDWGIAQIDRLMEQADGIPDQQLDEQLVALRRKMKYIGRRAGEAAPDAQAKRVRALISETDPPLMLNDPTSEKEEKDV